MRTWSSKPKSSQADEGRDTLTTGGKEVCVSFTRRMPFASTLRDHDNAKSTIPQPERGQNGCGPDDRSQVDH